MVKQQLIRKLQQIVGKENVLISRTESELCSYDASLARGGPGVVVFPATTGEVSQVVRAAYLSRVGRKPVHRLLFDHLLPYPQRLRWAARALALGKNSGMADLAQALGLLRVFGRNLIQANDLIAEMPVRAFRQRYKPGRYKGYGPGPDVGYFVGCGIDCMQAQAGRATLA